MFCKTTLYCIESIEYNFKFFYLPEWGYNVGLCVVIQGYAFIKLKIKFEGNGPFYENSLTVNGSAFRNRRSPEFTAVALTFISTSLSLGIGFATFVSYNTSGDLYLV